MDEHPVTTRPIGWWLAEAQTRLDAAFEAELEGTGVDRRGWQVLSMLSRRPASRADIVAALAPFDPGAAVEGLLERMAAAGSVADGPDGLTLTAEGTRLHDAVGPRVDAVRGQVAATLPEPDYDALMRLLARLVAGLPARPPRPAEPPVGAVRQLRLVVAVDDHEDVVRFYRDVLGMAEQEVYTGPGKARVTILGAGRATLEVANRAQQAHIDDVEVGRRVAGHLRVALEVDDTAAATEHALAGGAASVAPATRTPWGSLNARLDAPGDLHVTLFQELDRG